MGRPDYNSAIQQTSQQQNAGEHRACAQRPDAAGDGRDPGQRRADVSGQRKQLRSPASGPRSRFKAPARRCPTSNTAGALASLVAPAQAGLFSGGLIYQETPTITYTPLTGQPLIAQLATPITVDFLAALPDSDWPITSVMTFAVNYAAPNYLDTSAAINALSALDAIGAVDLVRGAAPRSPAAARGHRKAAIRPSRAHRRRVLERRHADLLPAAGKNERPSPAASTCCG